MKSSKCSKYSVKEILNSDKKTLLKILKEVEPSFYNILTTSPTIMDCRMRSSAYLTNMGNQYFSLFAEGIPDERLGKLSVIKNAIRVMKNVIKISSEKAAKFSALEELMLIMKGDKKALDRVSEGFLTEFIFLFIGIHGNSLKKLAVKHEFYDKKGREAALVRSAQLDDYALDMERHFKRYKCGLEPKIASKRERLKEDILKYFNATEEDWRSEIWQKRNVIKDLETISKLVKLGSDEIAGLKLAKENSIDVHITPYYMSLFNKSGRVDYDRAIRSQVLPSEHYCRVVKENRDSDQDLDFMGEKSTSPIDCVTRRYPHILILKPFDACPQICVYCQRNWEIKDIHEATITKSKIDEAIDWIKNHSEVTEVLVTGGDPLSLTDKTLDRIFGELSKIDRIERIRIGTRMFVTMPCRLNDGLMKVLEKYHKPGVREIAIMTHIEHTSEITPEVLEATTRVRKLGISIYNQQVFTYYNSRRFETCLLRKKLKLIGIDPYYNFNTKGKDETKDFRVPIARIEQEMKEEARLLPGIVRTDEPVFNVPRLGKSHLRAWQDHEPIMIMADGRRAFRFYPWESNLVNMKTYIYKDVAIYEYMTRLMNDGENLEDYASIWNYF